LEELIHVGLSVGIPLSEGDDTLDEGIRDQAEQAAAAGTRE
jgi:hypothetical protein